jgi:glycosyltransferase involved in cell wall biosynthesis
MRQWSNVQWFDPGMIDYGQYVTWLLQQSCDLLIAPLRDCHFNNCKSPLKYYEYSMLRIPGVYSDPGPYAPVIEHGVNGLLAHNLMDWFTHIRSLIDDTALRSRIGQAAYEDVNENYMLSDHVGAWSQAYEELLSQPYHNPDKHVPIKTAKYYYSALKAEQKELTQYKSKVQLKHSQLNAKIIELEDKLATREQTIDLIIQSPGWHLLAELGRIRKWFIPSHSKREEAFFLLLNKLSAFRQNGLKGLLTKSSAVAQPDAADNEINENGLSFKVETTETLDEPVISILVRVNDGNANIDVGAVSIWASEQTYLAFEIIEWDVKSQNATNISASESISNALKQSDLSKIMHGTYVVFASQHLLEQNETYLETNVIALSTDHLAYSVNLNGLALDELEFLRQEKLPGSKNAPFEKMVLRKDCIGDDFELDLSTWINHRIMGKIIHHTTNTVDNASQYSYGSILPKRLEIVGSYFVAIKESDAYQPIHNVDEILHPQVILDSRPTVFVVMPFVAIGGAENVALDMMKVLRDEVRFVIISTDTFDHSLGTKADAFRQITPYVYTAPDFLNKALTLSFWSYMNKRFNPIIFYIANGSENIYSRLPELKAAFPDLRFANQVYDHRFGWIERYDTAMVALMNANIGCNHKIRDAYLNQGVPKTNAFLIENGINCSIYDPDLYPEARRDELRQFYEIPSDKRIVTFMARLHPQKRPMDFLEVARRFQDDDSVFFLIVGNGPLTNQIDLEIMRIGLTNISRRPFSVSSDILVLSDVFVLPSEYEGMPLTILESLALGTPVVVTDVGNNKHVLDITQGGVIVNQIGDVNALRSGIVKMLNHPPDPQEIRQAVVQHFNVERMARQYYEALIGD